MKRRTFLSTAAASMPFMVNGMPYGTPMSPLFSAIGSDPSDRILVLLQLSGGNDGLATLVPIDQFDNLAHVRSNIIIPENQLTSLTDTLSLHPSIDNFRSVWDQGNLSIIQDVAYPNQDRSHFRSMDIWQSGSPADEIWDTGWLGRHLDQYHPTYPTNYPNVDHPDPIAVSLGYSISETCQGISGNFGLSVSNPYNLSDIFENGNQPPPAGKYGDELDYLRTTIAQSNAYGAVVKAAVEAGTSSRTYPNSYLGYQMQNIVKLITGGLRSKVYVLSVGGFDTHAGQVDPSDTRTGEHANLLSIINEALPVFLNDLADQGLSERVIGMTYSEFGRRIRSNAANGTDHGTAAPAFVFGSCVQPGVIGQNPTISRDAEPLDGVPMQYDFRDLYGSVLEDWFGVDEATIRNLLHDQYVRLPILRDCSDPVVSNENINDPNVALNCAPNPFSSETILRFVTTRAERVTITAYDGSGKVIEQLMSRRLAAGEQTVRVHTDTYPRGTVVFRLQVGNQARVVNAVSV